MKKFSFSRLTLYVTCPYRFYKKYVEGFEEPLTYPLALGKGVHKGIEIKLKGKSHDESVIAGIVEAEFHPEVTKQELSDLINQAPIEELNGELKIERHFELPLSDEPDSPILQGYIDVVGEGFIVDWKTNRATYRVTDNHQIGLYAWAMHVLEGWQEVYGHLYFLRFQRESGYKYTMNDMEKARSWAYHLAKEIQGKINVLEKAPFLKDELFPPQPSSACSHCPFVAECFQKFSPIAKN